MEYDWRTRFGVQFDPGVTMPWGECCRLLDQLLLDPSSHTFASLHEWEHPLSFEAITLTNVLEAYLHSHHDRRKGKFKPLPRPWPDPNKSIMRPTVSQAQVRAALARRGHGVTPKRPTRPRDARGRFVRKE